MNPLDQQNFQQTQSKDGDTFLNSNEFNDQNNGARQSNISQNNDQNNGDNENDLSGNNENNENDLSGNNENNKIYLQKIKEKNNFLDEIGRDHIDEMIDNYEQITDIMENEEELSKLSKDEIINLYKTEAKLKEQLDKVVPLLESENFSEIDNRIEAIENPAIQEYIREVSDDITDIEELDGIIEFAESILERAGNTQGSNNNTDIINSKKEIGGNNNQKMTTDIDPVQGMLSMDPKVRANAGKAMDDALEQMLSSQFK